MRRNRIATLGSGILLGTSLVLGGTAFAEEAAEAAATKSYEVDPTRSKTVNEDGSTTYDRTKSVTNSQTGKSATHTGQTTVTPTESGRAFDHTGTTTGPNGGVRTRHTTGSAAQAEDGTRTWGSTTDGSATGPKGRTRDWTTERGGSRETTLSGPGRAKQRNAGRSR